MRSVPMSEWKVLQRDRFPAYIPWERYLSDFGDYAVTLSAGWYA
jgi:hypothetical protein